MLLEMANSYGGFAVINEFEGVGAPVLSRGGAAGAISHGEMGGLPQSYDFILESAQK